MTAPAPTTGAGRPAAPGLSWLKSISLHAIVVVLGAFVLVPLLFGLIGGFKDTAQLSTNPFGLPSPWVPENYTGVLTSGAFWRQVLNSTFIALATTAIMVGLVGHGRLRVRPVRLPRQGDAVTACSPSG